MTKLIVAPLEALTDSRLSDPERRVLFALYSFRGKGGDDVWPKLGTIAERAGIKDQARVSKLTTALSGKGWLTKKKRGFTGGNRYTLTVPEVAKTTVEGSVSNLVRDANLEDEAMLDSRANSNLDSGTKSNLDSDTKCKELTKEQTNKQTKNRRFVPPTIQEVEAYCFERGNRVDPESFVDHYAANGWMRGKAMVKDWRACVRTWERSERDRGGRNSSTQELVF